MIQVYIGLGVLLVVGVIVWVLRVQHLRTTARDRLYVDTVETELKQDYLQLTPSLRRHYAIPWVIALAIGATLLLVVRIPLVYCVSITIIVGVIGYLIEGWNASRAALKIETQLANAIDLMVAGLSAGAGVSDSIDSAAREIGNPLKSELQEVLGRIRYGEKPSRVFEDLAIRIPLENVRLFAFTMAVHGEVGGSLAPTLSTVGKSIRDRIEIGRRVRAQSTQAQASVIGIVCITYFLGLLMWRTNPASFEEFLRNPIGANILAGAMVLQAVGLLWITRLSQLKF
jgi:tight adherence protein B